MATETVKALGRATSGTAITVYTNIYTVPTSTAAVVSSISMCNRGTVAATVRLAAGTVSATPGTSDFIVYDALIAPSDTVVLTIGLSMDATVKYLIGSASANTITFQASGVEIA